MKKIDNMQEQMSKITRVETLRKNLKEMLEEKNILNINKESL